MMMSTSDNDDCNFDQSCSKKAAPLHADVYIIVLYYIIMLYCMINYSSFLNSRSGIASLPNAFVRSFELDGWMNEYSPILDTRNSVVTRIISRIDMFADVATFRRHPHYVCRRRRCRRRQLSTACSLCSRIQALQSHCLCTARRIKTTSRSPVMPIESRETMTVGISRIATGQHTRHDSRFVAKRPGAVIEN